MINNNEKNEIGFSNILITSEFQTEDIDYYDFLPDN
jgi:hypothetical protein